MNRTLAPLERVTASNSAFGYPATDVYNFGYGEGEYIETWCTTESDSDPHIKMELTSPVLITQILFSGRTGTAGPFYATNLTLEYSPLDNNTIFHFYSTETGHIKVNLLILYYLLPYIHNHAHAVFCCTTSEHIGTAGPTFADQSDSPEARGMVY